MMHGLGKEKKNRRLLALVGVGILAFLMAGSALVVNEGTTYQVMAGSAPYSTLTAGPDGALVSTQTAYEATGFYRPGFSSPEDLVYDSVSGNFLVADTGNKRVCIIDEKGSLVSSFSDGLASPYGVSFDQDTYYVADRENASVELYDRTSLAHKGSYAKPANALFGSTSPYVPVKVSVNSKGVFVVSEGATKGVIQLDLNGNFVGYVGANKTEKSFVSWLQNLFYSASQKESLLKAAPASPTNLAFSSTGLLYTVTSGDASSAIKKLNTLGNVVMTPSYNLAKTMSIALDGEDNIFASTSEGKLVIYDGSGHLLFLFGGDSSYSERVGNLKSPKAVAVTATRELVALDGETGAVLYYQPTDFAKLVFEAISYYNNGLYVQGESLWKEILSYNSSFILSYRALAASDMKKGNYATALKEYELAQDRSGYSSAYWEVRNTWIQNNIAYVFIALAVVVVLALTLSFVYQRTRCLDGAALTIGKAKRSRLYQVFSFQGAFIHSPEDAVYAIKTKAGPNIWGASLLYLWYIVLRVLDPLLTSYLFNGQNIYNTNLGQIVLFSTVPVFLWILANYFVATVSDGEGKLKDLYVSTIYALSPYLLMALPIMLISRALTYNEQFLYTLLQIVMYGWCVILLFKNYSAMHDYSFWKTVKNLLLTIVAFAAFVLAAYVIYMMCSQLFGYLGQVFKELFNRG
jgi:tetratricopeptide (TPR) repeat protein